MKHTKAYLKFVTVDGHFEAGDDEPRQTTSSIEFAVTDEFNDEVFDFSLLAECARRVIQSQINLGGNAELILVDDDEPRPIDIMTVVLAIMSYLYNKSPLELVIENHDDGTGEPLHPNYIKEKVDLMSDGRTVASLFAGWDTKHQLRFVANAMKGYLRFVEEQVKVADHFSPGFKHHSIRKTLEHATGKLPEHRQQYYAQVLMAGRSVQDAYNEWRAKEEKYTPEDQDF